MTTTTAVTVTRLSNPPLGLELVADHLPEPVRTAFDDLVQAATDKRCVELDLAEAAPADKPELTADLAAAVTTVNEALTAYAEVGAVSTTAVLDSSAAAFVLAVEAADASIRQALDHLAEAGQAAALHIGTKPGRPPLRLDSNAYTEAPVRQQLAMLRSTLRGTLDDLPDAIR